MFLFKWIKNWKHKRKIRKFNLAEAMEEHRKTTQEWWDMNVRVLKEATERDMKENLRKILKRGANVL